MLKYFMVWVFKFNHGCLLGCADPGIPLNIAHLVPCDFILIMAYAYFIVYDDYLLMLQSQIQRATLTAAGLRLTSPTAAPQHQSLSLSPSLLLTPVTVLVIPLTLKAHRSPPLLACLRRLGARAFSRLPWTIARRIAQRCMDSTQMLEMHKDSCLVVYFLRNVQ